ncbi:MAG TPA: bifunctional UDP-N-acetylglucosamine diphosphorylase/glucosamine-1-phosphate N-acetyltransferase GlmU, partial [Thermoanaerobaculia bacterium]|nr:bifunctional UDP-N-acetylglucosamine diphosphorylase/glucosamine-1-phosphate N-acetyltransferase GlmU [Thermoanaerobaculia bacterium]
SRMRSSLPKVLHRVAGRTLLEAVLDTAAGLSPSATVVVVGKDGGRLEAALEGRGARFALQDPPFGTGDACARGLEALGRGDGPVVVLAGDTPLLRTETLARLLALRREKGLDLVFLTFRPPDPGEFGRVVRDGRRRPRAIVEAKNATARQKKISEVNAGVYCFEPGALARALAKIERNPVSGEYYLTDAVAILAAAGGRVEAIEAEDWREAWGVNTRRDLAEAEELERRRGVERALDAGVTILDPASVRIGPRVALAPDVVLHPFVSLEGRTELSEGCEVLPFTRLVDTRVEAGAAIGPHCEAAEARIGARSRVGPFSRLRPGTVIGEDVRIGNFVEVKNSVLGKGAKAQHLAYLGDADVGAGANVGAGVITCNYDGEKKHRTSIGEGAFIGTDTQLVAPVSVGKGAYVGAGTTVTEDVPDGALALSRSPQVNKEGWATRRKAKKS